MKKHQEKYTEIEDLKNKFIDIALLVGTILGFVAFIPSLLNAVETGFKINHYSDLLILVLFASVYVLRKKIRLTSKALFIIVGLFLFYITDLIRLGIFSDNKILMIVLLFLVFLIFRINKTIWVYILCSVSFAVIAYFHLKGLLGQDFNQSERAISIDVWIINFILITIVSFAIILILRKFNFQFLKLIEDLKEKNKQIIEKESNYTEIFNATSNAIFIHDMSGKILEVNDAMLKMYKYNKEDISNLGIDAFSSGLAPYDKEHAEEMIREAIEKGKKIFEWQAKNKEGKIFWAEVTLKKTIIAGKDRILAVVKDIDEQKQTALELEEYKNKLEYRVKERTEELEAINEELKTNNEELLILNENIQHQKNIIEEKEKRLNSIINNQGEGFSINDLNEKFILATPRAHEIFGVSPGELIGTGLREFFDNVEWEKILKQSKLRRKNLRSTYDIKITLKDGSQKHLIVTATPDYDETGNIIGTITNFRDITDRRNKEKKQKELNEELEVSNKELNEANEELLNLNENIHHQKNIIEEKEKRLKTIIQNQGEGLIITDFNENITFASPSAYQIFEVPDGELIGRNSKDFLDDNELKKIFEQSKQRKENIKSSYELMITLKNNKKKIVIVTGSPDYDENGKITGTISSFRDITDRIQKEKKLKELYGELEVSNKELSTQKDELQITLDTLRKTQKQLVQSEKMASLGVLASGVAHEINNPLNYIMGGITGLENVCKAHFDSNKKHVEPLINAIKEGIDRTANIVTGLNHFSRHGDSYKENCNIHSIIENCLSILQNKLTFRIEVIKNYQDYPIFIKGNEGKLHQLFLNLLSNAEQAIKDKGTIRITSKFIENYMIISIKDTGVGIEKEHLSKITDPFFTTKDPGKGTGLGLSIVYRIVEEHKGSIEFKSKLGKGTNVLIKMPVK